MGGAPQNGIMPGSSMWGIVTIAIIPRTNMGAKATSQKMQTNCSSVTMRHTPRRWLGKERPSCRRSNPLAGRYS